MSQLGYLTGKSGAISPTPTSGVSTPVITTGSASQAGVQTQATAQYEMTLGWAQGIVGVGERWWTPPLTPDAAVGWLNSWMQYRNNLLNSTCKMLGIRVKVYGQKRQSVLVLNGGKLTVPGASTAPSFPPFGTQNFADGGLDYAPVRNSLQCYVYFDGARKSSHYLAGIPKNVLGSEPIVFDSNNAGSIWWNQWQQYAAWIVGSCYISGINVEAYPLNSIMDPIQVQGNAPSLVGVSVTGFQGGIPSGTFKVQISGIRGPKGQRGVPTINGRWTVNSVTTSGTTTTFWLAGSAGISGSVGVLRVIGNTNPPGQQVNGSTIRILQQTLYPVQGFVPVRATVTRKRGRPILLYRGRVLSRLTLDP